jgi:hypothetical protein
MVTDCMALILVGVSHLKNLARFMTLTEWPIVDLTAPGWQISEPTYQL